MKPSSQASTDDAVREAAAGWTVRRDRGLSAAESIEFELWLAADARHGLAMQQTTQAWASLDRIPEAAAQNVLRHASTRRRSFWRRMTAVSTLAAAAAVAIVVLSRREGERAPQVSVETTSDATGPRTLTLSDGTIVRLNRDSEIAERFTAAERRVRLIRGEAHFDVTKNRARPFVVEAGSVDVRAVGTAFDVQLQSSAIEVLVTEGVVKLNPTLGETRATVASDAIPLLNPGHRAVVALKPVSPEASVVVTAVSADEIKRTLAWQEPLLRLGGATLAEIVAEFERRSGQHVILADPALAQLRMGGRFRADNLEGFAELLATTFEIDVEHAPDGTLVLRKENSGSR